MIIRHAQAWLARRGVKTPEVVADTAIAAARTQLTSLFGEAVAATLVKDLAIRILEPLNKRRQAIQLIL